MLKKNKKKNDITALQNYATLTSRKNNKNRLFLMKDMMKCYKLYGCHYEEYYYNRFAQVIIKSGFKANTPIYSSRIFFG